MNKFVKTFAERLAWICALGLVLFFARWKMQGLQPDAALYAGLSLKVLRTGEQWLLTGSPYKFPAYFEHPPYFFQWGARVLQLLGTSDGAARAIGSMPALLGFLSIVGWTWLRLGWPIATLCALMLATFGHYTKYAATSMLEAPLSLAVVWVAIATWELHWQPRTALRRPFLWILLLCGLSLATASKGVAGLGAWGGMCLSMGLALFFSERHAWKVFLSLCSLLVTLVVGLSPLGYWVWQLWHRDGQAWVEGYFSHQVLRSFTTNREDATASDSPFYYVYILLKNSWPWGWTVLLAWVALVARPFLRKEWRLYEAVRNKTFVSWTLNSLAFFLAYFLPFSVSRYKLPHYLHPTYAVLAPAGAFVLAELIKFFKPNEWLLNFSENVRVRWSLVAFAAVALILISRSDNYTENRGQVFVKAAAEIKALPAGCQVLAAESKMDVYRMEAYSLWYWEARPWRPIPKELPSKITVRDHSVYWDPEQNILWHGDGC